MNLQVARQFEQLGPNGKHATGDVEILQVDRPMGEGHITNGLVYSLHNVKPEVGTILKPTGPIGDLKTIKVDVQRSPTGGFTMENLTQPGPPIVSLVPVNENVAEKLAKRLEYSSEVNVVMGTYVVIGAGFLGTESKIRIVYDIAP